MEKINRFTNEKLEKFRLNFFKVGKRLKGFFVVV